MAKAAEARTWARGALRGIGDSLYTPFSGTDGDDIDWDAYRTLVRYCVGDLGHPMLWCTSGLAEFWSLTLEERKRLLEVAIEEARRLESRRRSAGLYRGDERQGLPGPDAARCAGRRRHRLHPNADDGSTRRRRRAAILQIHRGPYGHRARHVQLPVVWLCLAPVESARIYDEVPAVCATKEGAFRPEASRRLHELAPDLAVWECDRTVYRAGWLRAGIVCPAQLGTAGYLFETPAKAAVFRVLGSGAERQAAWRPWTTA